MAECGDIDHKLSKPFDALSIAREPTVYFKFGNEPKKLNAYRCQGQGRECENIAIFYEGKYLCGECCSENYETKIRLFYCEDYDKDIITEVGSMSKLPSMPGCIWSDISYCRQHHSLECREKCTGKQLKLLYCKECGDVHFAKSQLKGQLNKYHAIISRTTEDQLASANSTWEKFKSELENISKSFDNPGDMMGTLNDTRCTLLDLQYYTCVKYLSELDHLDMKDYKDRTDTPLDIVSLYGKYAECLRMPQLGYDDIMRDKASISRTTTGNSFVACGIERCHNCPKFGPYFSVRINNNNTKEWIQGKLNCTSDKVVYIISCHLCHMQYVGKTDDTVKKRYKDHRVKKDRPLRKHFSTFHDKKTADELECSCVAVVKKSDEVERGHAEKLWTDKSKLRPFSMNSISGSVPKRSSNV